MSAINFFVSGRPMPKERARITRHGNYTPKKTRQWENMILFRARNEMTKRGVDIMTGPVELHLQFIFETPKSYPKKYQDKMLAHITKPDADNLEKAVKDALNRIVYLDDAQVYRVVREKMFGEKEGVHIMAIERNDRPHKPKRRKR